nr:MAG TPA: hypothetical protein [Caudoviricetes sp.]DAR01206.1 MAG TPA: hypothetical protein [Caudoviricetes sp.]
MPDGRKIGRLKTSPRAKALGLFVVCLTWGRRGAV